MFSQTPTPNAFSFADQTGVAVNSTISSNAVTLSGFVGSQTATCTNCTAIARNGSWGGTTVAGFTAGDTIAIRVTSSPNNATAVTAVAHVGGKDSGTWMVTTASLTGPNAFSFTDVTGATIQVTYSSNAVALSGFTGTLTATCNTCTGIARNGVWGISPYAGFTSGDTIAIRQTSSAGAGNTVATQVTVGATTSSNWSVTTASACSAGITVGGTCPDGTIYAGTSPDGIVPMYTTPCDAGMTLSGGICTGSRLTKTWNNGTSNWKVTGFTSMVTGRANTLGLAALDDSGDAYPASPYKAAVYCNGLSTGGHTDWYLPSTNELNILYTNRVAIGGFETTNGDWYWSSTEVTSDVVWIQRFTDGNQNYNGKSGSNGVRCVRR
ncbi:DUF1566 domain-containing protein [Rhodomicrobium udaipurense]|uniref:DUF1566 domain-containing protein n=1 Tax=Rhodomicrobium udaipurense TaxID=1202716 RepID=A0A8I1GEV6_9HYPH|nr:DUF1566 domain-containing protein [Rhodomicrobium udaipurense]